MIKLPALFREWFLSVSSPAARTVLMIILLCKLSCLPIYGQSINFEDGFSDGDFTQNPAWIGDTTHFVVTRVNDNYQLRLRGDQNNGGIAYLSVPSSGTIGDWEFYINFEGFAPSAGNKAEIVLMSDISDLTGAFNGYVLQGGENGSEDVFRIIRFDNGSPASIVLSGTTNISAGGDYRVKVSRTNDGTWMLSVANTYEDLPVPEATPQIDNTYTSTAYFGVKVTYSATRYNRFFFDFKIDLPPFAVQNITASASSVNVTFNRNYDPSTVQAADFNTTPDLGPPASILFTSPSTVRLNYNSNIQGNRYELSVNNIWDEHGEQIALNSRYEFYVFDPSFRNDVVINEFMYDPPLGLPEYVELKNRSGNYLNLMGWKIGDKSGTGTIVQDTLVLEPGSLLAISSDTAALTLEFGSGNYLSVNTGNFPSLNNGGDAIRILNNQGILIDSLYYYPDWGGEDIAMERRSVDAVSDKKANWGDSPQGIGTPGSPNLVEQDINPPVLTAVNATGANILLLSFNEELDAQSATDASHYAISPAIGINLISTIADSVLIYLSSELQPLQTYIISVNGVKDIFGNAMDTYSLDVRYIPFGRVATGDIVINEILYDETENGYTEFVELFNTTKKNFDLSEWLIGDATDLAKLPERATFLAGDYLVLTADAGFANGQESTIYISGFPSLNNSDDIIFLKDREGITVDSLNYTKEWSHASPGVSMERKDPSGASNDPSNWKESAAGEGHTAGLENSVHQRDQTPPSMIFAKRVTPELISVHFNEFIDPEQNTVFDMDGSVMSIEGFEVSNANRILLKTPVSKSRILSQVITARNLRDMVGNNTTNQSIPLARKVAPGDVVINEIMYNPISDSEDNLPDQSEYVELKNTRDYAISLEGIYLRDATDENGEVRSLNPVSSKYKWIPAGGLALIYSDEKEAFTESKIASFFGLQVDNTLNLRIDRSSLGLANDRDAIYLADPSGTTIDSVFYEESWQNPNLIDTRGIALERINPLGPSSDPSNWSSNTLLLGGTPGSENSIFQVTANQPESTGISFSPNPFSPDDDGTDDHLFINYKLDQPDYLLKVQIYDRYGRLVRKLADGVPGSFEGSLIWDGRNDNGKSNRIGIYIVVFEAINSTVGRNRAFKKTVVLARRLQ
ncbi:hypothetical protein G3570_15490 [Balneolaceae bacterium YR4-1]|uniref:LTD domain-containing protein n=1 Tax=Halalkalibaculum roseum TaxID=2709311 RepID=A0A6M1SY93_9BACT|nr:lamin tail domain-containing protein [Halalkalibaculum roseum]NGP78052.1 hypothetical protein [Halalkalibaculum roseum]